MSDIGSDSIRPGQAIWQVRKVDRQPREKRDEQHGRQQQAAEHDADEKTKLVDTFA